MIDFLDDIKIDDKTNPNRNNRIVLFYGNEKVDGVDKNGQIDVISSGTIGESYEHIFYLKSYLEERCLDNPVMQKYGFSSPNNNASVILYLLLAQYNDLIFLETTKNGSKNRYGMIYIPDEITPEQCERWNEYKEQVKDYNEVTVFAGFYLEDGLINQRIYDNVKGDNIDSIEGYFNISSKNKSI